MTIRVPETRCLSCGVRLDAATQVAKPGEPHHSERPSETEFWFTICIACGHLMAVNRDLTLRELTDAEAIDLTGDSRIVAINRVRGKIK
jgi:hypothetical protein